MTPSWQSLFESPDPARFERFFSDHKALVWTICVRRLSMREDAEEAFQATWARFLAEGRAGRMPEVSGAGEWLCRLAGRESDALRKRTARRRSRETAMAMPPDVVDSSPGSVQHAIDAQTRAGLEQLVQQLPDKLRLPVQLHYLHGMTIREVAAALDVPVSTVDSRLKAARRDLEPEAERAGLRTALGVMMGGGMMAGLLAPPSHLTAASILAAPAAAATAGAFGSSKTIAVIAALIVFTVTSMIIVSNPGRKTTTAIVVTSAPPPTSSTPETVPTPVAPTLTPAPNPATNEASLEIPTPSPSNASPVYLLAVSVASHASGEPIVGARVRAYNTWNKYDQVELTDRDGIARFADTPPGSLTVCATAEGYALASASVGTTANDPIVTLQLRAGAVIFGKVTDTNNQPISGARILYGFNGQPACFEFPASEENGNWQTLPMPQGEQIDGFVIHASGYKTKNLPNIVTLSPGIDRHELNVQLQKATAVSGIVLDARNNQPIANARIYSEFWSTKPATTTNALGQFELQELNGTSLLAHAGAYAPVHQAITTDSPVTIKLNPGLTAAGRVLDSNKRPVANAELHFRCLGGTFLMDPVITNHTGGFDISGLTHDAELEVKAANWPAQPIHRNVGGRRDLEIILRRAQPIRGIVTSADTSEPIRRFTVKLAFTTNEPDISYGMSPFYMQGTDYDDPNGRFVLGSFPEGYAFKVQVEADGYQPAIIEQYVVGTKPMRVELLQLPEQELIGQVVDTTGAPIPSALVALYTREHSATNPFSWAMMYLVTDYALQTHKEESASDGTFRLRQVAMPGGADLIITAPGFARYHSRLESLPESPITITLEREARLRIRVNREMHPHAHSIELLGTGGQADWDRIYLSPENDVTEAGGFPPRTFLARVYTYSPTQRPSEEMIWSESLTFAPGETLDIEIGEDARFSISGQVIQNGAACCGGDTVLLGYSPADSRWGRLGGKFAGNVAVASDGSFSFDNLQPGNYLLDVIGRSTGLSRFSMESGIPLTVAADEQNIVIHRRTGGSVKGRIPSVPQNYLPGLSMLRDGKIISFGGIDLNEDGSFEVRDLAPGEYIIKIPDAGIIAQFQIQSNSVVDLGELNKPAEQ